jgi:hypothetical protein
VARKAKLLDVMDQPADLLEMLISECAVKEETPSRNIGFRPSTGWAQRLITTGRSEKWYRGGMVDYIYVHTKSPHPEPCRLGAHLRPGRFEFLQAALS